MKIAYNPKGAAALTKVPEGHEDDILFDLQGLNIFAKGIKFKGTDTTYLIFKKHTSAEGGGYNGLVPVPSYTTTNIRFLREDGTWQAPSLLAYSLTIQTNGTTLGSFNGSADKVFNITYENVGAAPAIHTHTSNQIIALTDYTKAASDSLDFSIEATDSLNVALGKLEYKADLGVTAYNIVSAANDGDGTIENLNEILKVLQGIKDTDTITGILANYVTLNTTLTIVGEKTFSLLLKSTVATGTAPLSVTSTTLNTNLNADLLDGLHYTSFARADQNPNVDLDTVNGIGIMCNPLNDNATTENHYPIAQAGVLFYGTGAYKSACLIYGTYENNALYYRGAGYGPSEKKPWREVAFIDSNVLSATKLLNKRYLWGQEFDGTADVSGNMTNVGNIIASGIITTSINGKAFLFGSDGAYIGSNVGSDFYMWGGGDIKLRLGTNNQERITILGNGDVGIGITSPTLKLHVAGNVLANYYNSAINDEALSDIGSVYVRNTSDTFIRRVSKTLFYSILDDKFVTLDTAQTISGNKTFIANPILNKTTSIILYQNSTSNYTTAIIWYKGGVSLATYNPQIGQYNMGGGDQSGSITILPYSTETQPWSQLVGLSIAKNRLLLDGKLIALAENCVTSLGTSDNYLTWTKNGTTNNITVPYANMSAILFSGHISATNSHADNLKNYFNANKASIPRNAGLSYFSSAYRNGSQYFGYFISGYNDNPYGGFFVAHYDNPHYIGIQNGVYNQLYILTNTNYTGYLDSRYVNVTGDTMTGYLNITTNSRNLKLGSENIGFAHYITNADNGHWFNKNAYVAGQIYAGPSYNQIVWNAGNDGSGSGLDADLLDGYHESAFVRDRYIGSKGDYQDVVILLWKDSDVTTHRIVGKLFTTAGGSSRWQYADINFWFSRWSSGYEYRFLMNTDATGANFRLVTCTYQGATWWALKHTNIQAVTFYFQGTSNNINWQLVHYYTLNTGGVVNSEIRNSLQNKDSLISSSIKGGFVAYATLNDNVASATKLLNTRTIWGQNFDGTNNVTGTLTVNGSINNAVGVNAQYIELSMSTPYIDFHYNKSTADYTSRIIEDASGLLRVSSKLKVNTSTNSYNLNTSSFICDSWVRTLGAAGWYSETYGGGWWMKDKAYIRNYGNKRLLIEGVNDYYAVWLSSGGFCCEGYTGASWDNGYGALNVGIADNGAQTPLIVAYRNGSAAAHTGASRLFAMELLNNGAQLRYGFGGSVKFIMYSSGELYATHFYEHSDIRYKTVVNNLSIKANQIANIPLFDFKWKDNENLLNTGTSAQAVQLILPYLVSGEEKLTLNYGVLGTIAGVIACKELTEQEKEIEKLKDRVKELENKLTLFNSRF